MLYVCVDSVKGIIPLSASNSIEKLRQYVAKHTHPKAFHRERSDTILKDIGITKQSIGCL